MDVLVILAFFLIDIVIHYYTIQSWGWLQTIWINLLVMLVGWLLFQWCKSSIKIERFRELDKKYSKKKIRKMEYVGKNQPEKLSAQDKEYMSIQVITMMISFGFILVIFPGLLTGFIGMALMVIGFIGSKFPPQSD
ncbi:MAG: FxsA family protein [Marinicella sp.]